MRRRAPPHPITLRGRGRIAVLLGPLVLSAPWRRSLIPQLRLWSKLTLVAFRTDPQPRPGLCHPSPHDSADLALAQGFFYLERQGPPSTAPLGIPSSSFDAWPVPRLPVSPRWPHSPSPGSPLQDCAGACASVGCCLPVSPTAAHQTAGSWRQGAQWLPGRGGQALPSWGPQSFLSSFVKTTTVFLCKFRKLRNTKE